MLLYCDWVEANALAPVPHRQYVLTVPKLLRPAFGIARDWANCAASLRAYASMRTPMRSRVPAWGGSCSCRPFVQTFGDLAIAGAEEIRAYAKYADFHARNSDSRSR